MWAVPSAALVEVRKLFWGKSRFPDIKNLEKDNLMSEPARKCENVLYHRLHEINVFIEFNRPFVFY